MFERAFNLPLDNHDSLFVFGPHGTGKTLADDILAIPSDLALQQLPMLLTQSSEIS